MYIFSPDEVAERAGNKYLGVLVAAKFARYVNDFPRDRSLEEKKLTTRALESLSGGELTYRLVHQWQTSGGRFVNCACDAQAVGVGKLLYTLGEHDTGTGHRIVGDDDFAKADTYANSRRYLVCDLSIVLNIARLEFDNEFGQDRCRYRNRDCRWR